MDTAPVINLNLYRAMNKNNLGLHTLENDNMADLPGVLKYFHTEVIAESHVGDPDRAARKYGIDVIARWDFKVKNSPSMLRDGSPDVNLQDFGPFVTYDYGQSTNEALDSVFTTHGDFVGAQFQRDPRFNFADPYFWFSVSGFCPNLPFVCTDNLRSCPAHDPPIFTARCGAAGCTDKGRVDAPDAQCIKFHDGSVIAGGLCAVETTVFNPNDVDDDPKGVPGCTYSFKNQQTVNIDDLAGITQEDCGGHMCRDWEDFRKNCANPDYRRKFDASGRIQEFTYCVEYDIHPYCSQAQACFDPQCLALPSEERELGLPFWKGRCSPLQNRIRAEVLANGFGIVGANYEHRSVASDMREVQFDTSCDRPGAPAACRANPTVGGTYCTRYFSGVCSSCFIPGTKQPYPIPTAAYCPYYVLSVPDYSGLQTPTCKSKKASDLCCLYVGDCDGETDPDVATLDLDGFFLISSLMDTEKLDIWVNRYIEENMGRQVVDEEKVRDSAYWLWDHKPQRDFTLKTLEEIVTPFLNPTTTMVTTSTQYVPFHDNPVIVPADSNPGHSTFFYVFIVLVLVAAGGGIWHHFSKNKKPVVPPPEPATGVVEMNTRYST